MRISDWSSDVCSSDLLEAGRRQLVLPSRYRRAGGRGRPSAHGHCPERRAGGGGATLDSGKRCSAHPQTGPSGGCRGRIARNSADRKSVVKGKSGSVSGGLGGRRFLKKKTHMKN